MGIEPDSPLNMFVFLFSILAVSTAQQSDWCIDERTGMLACFAGSSLWERSMNASHCYEESAARTAVPEEVFDRQDNCLTKEDLDKYGDYSARATCVLESMGFLGKDGGVKNGRIKRNMATLNPRVVEKYSRGNITDNDPSGYKQCIDNSFLTNMIPHYLERCKDKYPKDHGYRRQIKRFWKRWAAYVCFHSVRDACTEVMIENISTVAMSGSAPGTEDAA